MLYESARDVELRLRNSLVMYNQRPVQVNNVISKTAVEVEDILTRDVSAAKVRDLDLDPSHAKLGYVITTRGVYMASRKPVRRFKQGLTNENMVVRGVMEKRGRERDISFNSRAVAKTILGEFPDCGTAFQQVRKGESKIVPFSRDWAVAEQDGDLCLVYRGNVVGYADDGCAKLLPECFYLKEGLELCLK